MFKGRYHTSHEKIRDKLINLISSIHPDASVHKEQTLVPFKKNLQIQNQPHASQQSISSRSSITSRSSSPSQQSDLRADILVTHRIDNYFLDLTGANPCSKTAVQSGSWEKPNVASNLAEKGKVRKYNDYLKPDCWDHFIPFAFEYTCRLGVKATQFMNVLCN